MRANKCKHQARNRNPRDSSNKKKHELTDNQMQYIRVLEKKSGQQQIRNQLEISSRVGHGRRMAEVSFPKHVLLHRHIGQQAMFQL